MKPTVCRCCGQKIESGSEKHAPNPNLCFSCLDWTEETELATNIVYASGETRAREMVIRPDGPGRFSQAA